jgi:hypothetical protein
MYKCSSFPETLSGKIVASNSENVLCPPSIFQVELGLPAMVRAQVRGSAPTINFIQEVILSERNIKKLIKRGEWTGPSLANFSEKSVAEH